MVVVGEMKIIFSTNCFESAEEAKLHLDKELLGKLRAEFFSCTKKEGTLIALDVPELEIYDDID